MYYHYLTDITEGGLHGVKRRNAGTDFKGFGMCKSARIGPDLPDGKRADIKIVSVKD